MRYFICCLLIVCVLSGVALASPEPSDGDFLPVVESPPADAVLTDVQVISTQTPVASSNGLKGILLQMLGSYDPPVVIYQYQQGNNYSYIREVVPDYPWIGSCLVFLLLIYGIIRFGGVLCRK